MMPKIHAFPLWMLMPAEVICSSADNKEDTRCKVQGTMSQVYSRSGDFYTLFKSKISSGYAKLL